MRPIEFIGRTPTRRWFCPLACLVLCSLLLAACQPATVIRGLSGARDGASTDVVARTQLYLQTNWLLAPFDNLSDTHTAPDAVATLLETHLRRRGVTAQVSEPDKALYRVDGVITRWQHEGDASAQASIAMTLNVHGAATGELLWSASGSDVGRRGESMAAVADSLIAELVERLPLVDAMPPAEQPVGLVATGDVLSQGAALGAGNGRAATAGQTLLVPALRLPMSASDIAGDGPEPVSDAASAFDMTSLEGRSIAFFYGADLPVEELAQFDHLVLEPDNVLAEEMQKLNTRGVVSHAYLSVGEVGPSRGYARDMQPAWMLGHNPHWDSRVLDLSNPALRDFLVARAGELKSRGFAGLFLDTMDSFHLIADTEEERQRQQAGLVDLVRTIATEHPELRLISNRGFEVLDEIAPYVASVAAESLYARWNPAEQRHDAVPEGDREWLLGKLNHARDVLDLDVIAIDYLPAARREQARQVARRIASHGFIPWVANPALDMIGVGALEVLPRKVLMLYDSSDGPPLEETPVHKFAAMPIEYHGYVPEYLDLAEQVLPAGPLKGRYAGIVTWTEHRFRNSTVVQWLKRQLEDTVPVVMLGTPPVTLDESFAELMGISLPGPFDVDTATVAKRDDLIKPERTLATRFDSINHVSESTASSNRVHMSLVDASERRADIVVTGRFGGFAWQPGLVDDEVDLDIYWVIEPFEFFKHALQLPDAPMPDVTSENGKRLWLAHIDGDALPSWAEFPGGQLGAEVIHDEILTRYQAPHTISVVEAELTENPAHDDRRDRMFDIARRIFRLDTVELASHTYSHPFHWKSLAAHRFPGRYNLAIDGYIYNPERDIAGSIDFVNRELAPPDKRLEMFLWSGNALPGHEEMAVLHRLGVPNMNGGPTFATNDKPTMTLISPMARPVGDYVQVYAPIMNENMYTNDWLGPFDGFRHVNETFRLTESPRRLKPMNVYYHFYSGTKRSSMKALKAAYDYSLSQDVHPVFGSDYARKVPDFRRAGVARRLDGRWKLSGLGHVRSLRLLNRELWPALASAEGLVGARRLHDGIYLHTDGRESVQFATVTHAPRQVHLVSSNGRVDYWKHDARGLRLRIRGEMPVSIELGGAVTGCSLHTASRIVQGERSAPHASADTLTFTFTSKDTGHASLHCPT